MPHIAVVYHSGYGHTAVLAEAVKRGAESVAGTKVELIKAEEADKNWELLEKVDGIIFGAPTYMGSVSAQFKTFMDASSKAWFQQKWANKLAAGFTNSASMSGDKFSSLQQLITFAMQHSMVWVGLGLMPGKTADELNRIGSFSGLMAQSDSDKGPDVAPPESDRKTAEHLGKRFADTALRYKAA